MKANARLTERLVRDLNEDQSLPYKDEQFDAVSVQRLPPKKTFKPSVVKFL